MSLTEVVPEVQSLSRLDKIRLIQVLAQEARGRRERPDRTGAVLSRVVSRPRVYRSRSAPPSTGGRERQPMTAPTEQFPYVPRDPALGNASLAPMLPLTLTGRQSVTTSGLVDSGAAINVLPFSLGTQMGFDWEQQTKAVELSGNLASVEARVVVVSAVVGKFVPVRLAFAWAKTDSMGVILGQVNFFLEFDICFFRSRAIFEIRPKQGP